MQPATVMLKLARTLRDAKVQAQHEAALALRASDDPADFDAGWAKGRIFVSIAAFRDPECQKTVADLFAKAAHPERITVGLVRQMDEVLDAAHLTGPAFPEGQVRELRVDWRETRGVCWARFLAQSLWRGEQYLLQTDAHMIFEQDWDALVIDELEGCPGDKRVLTFAPPPYLSPGDVLADLYPGVLRTDGFLGDGAIRFTGVWAAKPLTDNHRMPFLLAGGLFAPAALIAEVPYDPHQCFGLEEASYAARLFTHGWDVYSARTRIAWHQYKHNNTLKRGGCDDPSFELEQLERTRRGYVRFDHMTKHGRSTHGATIEDLDLFGLGEKRTLAEYEDFAGLDFRGKRASEHAMRARYIPNVSQVVQFSVPRLDGDDREPFEIMSEEERLLRIALRKWSLEQLAEEIVSLMLAIATSDMANASHQQRGAEIFAKRAALLADFEAWDHDALTTELARLVIAVSSMNAAQESARQTEPLAARI